MNDENDKLTEQEKLGRTMRVAGEVARRGGDEIVKAGELVTVRTANGKSMSLAARRMMNLMIHRAAGDAWREQEFSISKATLRRGHKSNDRIEDLMHEIATTEVIIENRLSSRKTPGRLIVPILMGRFDEYDQSDSAMVFFEFHPKVAELLKVSETYALLSPAAMLAFESKYSLVIYEMGCKISGRHVKTEMLSLAELRELIGVPPGKMEGWSDLRRFTLEKAKREINQLAERFTFDWEEIRQGSKGKVVAVRLIFNLRPGDDALVAAEEAERHSAGRRARRNGTVEKIVDASPALPAPVDAPKPVIRESFPEGSISYSEPWRTIARTHGGGWDINAIADEFRRSSTAVKLRGNKLEVAFTRFCEKWAENRRKA